MSLPALKPSTSEFDLVSLGALVHRLDPGAIPFRSARAFDVHVSGGEYNVAANLSACFGLRTAIATAMVNYGIGELVQARVREAGVTPLFKWFDHDGVRGPNIATVYSDRGQGVRAPVVFYNRANEAAALLKPGDFDWRAIHARGVRWFHSGGIFAALSATTAELIQEGLAAARAAGAVTSFDLNYRAKLWDSIGGPAAAQQAMRRIAGGVEVLFGDLENALGIEPAARPQSAAIDPDAYFLLADRAVEQFPNVRLIATTLRQVHSANRHEWAAALWLEGQRYVTPTLALDVLDRIGGGDGFSAGLIYGLLNGRSPEESLRLGWAHGALVTTYPGDVTMARASEVEAFASGTDARVQR